MNLENILRDHWVFLRENTGNISAILAQLYSKRILNREERELIKNPFLNATSHDTNESLYDTLLKKDLLPEILKNILLETSNELIVDRVWANLSKDADYKFWNVGQRNDNFTGRCEIFDIFENSLDSKSWMNSTLKFVLYGMGGVGKTSIVTEFLYRNRSKFSNIFWFGAEANLVQQICQLAKELKFGNTDSDALDSKDKFEFAQTFIKNWFEKKCDWIIVYDNVGDFNEIRHFIPRFGGIVVVTSRNTIDWSDLKDISINCFERSESCQLIQKILKIEYHNEREFDELSADLGYLPLAISISCHFIKAHKIMISEYLNYSKMAEEEFLKICPDFEEKSVWKSVKISLDKINEECPLAFEFLKLISFLRAEDIPKLLLEEFLIFLQIDKMKLIKIQKFMLKYDLVKLEYRGEHQLYSIHRLVQKSIKLSIKNEASSLLVCSGLISIVCTKYTALDTKYILHHAIHLLLYLFEFVQKRIDVEDIEILRLLNKSIVSLISGNKFTDYLSEIKDLDDIICKYYLTIADTIVDYNDQFKLCWAIAVCFRSKNDFSNAIQMFEKELVLSQELFGEISNETSKVYHNIGLCFSDLNQLSKALEFYEKSLKIVIELYGVDSSELITNYSNLGSVCIELKDFNKAQEYLDKGLKLVLHHNLQNSSIAAVIFVNLGGLNYMLGELETAKKYYRKDLKILILLYGENSLKVLEELKNIGDVYANLNPTFALEFYQKLAEIEAKFNNESSQETLNKLKICINKITEKNPDS